MATKRKRGGQSPSREEPSDGEREHRGTFALVLFALLAVSLLTGGPSHAGGMSVENGEWEMTSTTTHPMTGQPQSFTSTECIKGDVDPDAFSKNASGCQVSDIQSSSSSLSWTMRCGAPGGQMEGRAEVNASEGGKKIAGSMTMTTSFGGQTTEISSQWAGRWVGPCP